MSCAACPVWASCSAPGCWASSATTNRYADAKARKNYAGSAPITKQSGKRKIVLARFKRNHWLADALHCWAFASLSWSPGARAFYDQRRAAGDEHDQALRALSNGWVGILHGCLRHRARYDEDLAWRHRTSKATSGDPSDAMKERDLRSC